MTGSLLGVLDRSCAAAPSEDTQRAIAVSDAYVNVGLPEEVSNQFNQTLNFTGCSGPRRMWHSRMRARSASSNILAGLLLSLARMGYEAHSPAIPGFVRSRRDYPIVVPLHFHHCYRFVEETPGPPDT